MCAFVYRKPAGYFVTLTLGTTTTNHTILDSPSTLTYQLKFMRKKGKVASVVDLFIPFSS